MGISLLRDRPTERGAGAQTDDVGAASQVAGLSVELLRLEDVSRHVDAWAELASRALEPNPFMAPGFCLPAARHLGGSDLLSFLFVWDEVRADARRLVALVPLARPRWEVWPLARVWFHNLAALGAPLFAPDRGEAALQAVFAWLERNQPGRPALVITAIDLDGPTAVMIERFAQRGGRGFRVLDVRRRAMLPGRSATVPSGLAALSNRRAKELLRQRRRLSGRGQLDYRSARSPVEVQSALTDFLALERRGWKGRAGTALAADPRRDAFTREMVAQMTADGRCRIDMLRLDGVPIGMGIVLTDADRHYFWKTTFDEAHAAASPGVQFVLDLTERQGELPGLALTDSCAMPDHPMIDRLWPGRLTIADIVIGTAPGQNRWFAVALALETFRRRARALLKNLHVRLREALVPPRRRRA